MLLASILSLEALSLSLSLSLCLPKRSPNGTVPLDTLPTGHTGPNNFAGHSNPFEVINCDRKLNLKR